MIRGVENTRIMASFIIRIVGNTVALWVAYYLVPGFFISGNLEQYLIAGVILGLLNMVVKPILKAISFPLILLTLGLFTLVINGFILWLLDYLVSFITIESITALIGATLIVTIINLFFSIIAKLA